MMVFSLPIVVFSLITGFGQYVVIWIAIAALCAGLAWIAIQFIFTAIANIKWSRKSHTAEEHLDRYAFLAGYSKKDLQPEPELEQVAERPHVALKGEYNDKIQVIEWGEWKDKSVLKS